MTEPLHGYREVVTADTEAGAMEVLVSGVDGTIRLTFVGEVDEAAPAIARAAVAAAKGDHVALHVDTSRAHPRTSPILERVRRTLRTAAAHQAVEVR